MLSYVSMQFGLQLANALCGFILVRYTSTSEFDWLTLTWQPCPPMSILDRLRSGKRVYSTGWASCEPIGES